MNFAVFVSGNGSNLQAIINAIKAKKIKASLAVVISNKEDAFALERARKAKIPSLFIDPKKFPDRESFDRAVVMTLKEAGVDFIVLAGFMRILSPYFIKAYRHKILNIHPSLLPAFKGAHAIDDAWKAGVSTTGVTVHFVDEEIDHGAIILQKEVTIKPKDTLAKLEARIHKVEHGLYPKVIDLFARGRIKLHRGKVTVR